MRAVGDKIILVPDEKKKTTEGGLKIPDGKEEKTTTGKVIWVGDHNAFGNPIPVKEGDKVIYTRHAGHPVNIEGVDYLCIKTGDIEFVL